MRCLTTKQPLTAELQFLRGTFKTFHIPPTIILTAGDDHVTLVGSNSNMTLVSRVPASVVEPGEGRTNAMMFASFVASLPKGEVTIATDEKGNVIVGADTFEAKLWPHQPDTVFMPSDEGMGGVTVPARLMLAAVNRIIDSLPETGDQSLVQGALLVIGEDCVRIVAVDRARMALASTSNAIGLGAAEKAKFVLPQQALEALPKMLADLDGDVRIQCGPEDLHRPVIITAGHRQMFTRAVNLESPFPPYAKAIPASFDVSAEMNRRELIAALRRTTVLAEQDFRAVFVRVSTESVHVSVEAKHKGDSAEEYVPACGDGVVKFKVNAQYLLNALQAIGTDDCRLELTTAARPIVIKPVNDDVCASLFVVVPLVMRN